MRVWVRVVFAAVTLVSLGCGGGEFQISAEAKPMIDALWETIDVELAEDRVHPGLVEAVVHLLGHDEVPILVVLACAPRRAWGSSTRCCRGSRTWDRP